MQDILIHVRDIKERTPAGYYGVRLAATFGATATGVFVCPTPLAYAPAYNPELVAAVMENARTLERDALHARRNFLDWASSLGVAHADWLVAEGDASRALAQAASRHDLLVIDHAASEEQAAWDLPDIILRAGIPCIVTPHHALGYRLIERIAIGWNGSPEAMRALHAALPFMRGKQVLLMTGEVRDTYHGVLWKTPFDVGAYLERHGITVEQTAITTAPADAGGALLEEAMHFRADLLVMGAYGRSRFSEWLLGGATRYALAWAEMPLLLQH